MYVCVCVCVCVYYYVRVITSMKGKKVSDDWLLCVNIIACLDELISQNSGTSL